jgi:ABC-type Na+ efflux pump permease subunit
MASRSNRSGAVLVGAAVLLAALSYLGSVNEYVAVFGEAGKGSYDCDGPDTVLAFSVPPLLLAIAGIAVSVRSFRAHRGTAAVVALCVGVVVMVALAARVPALVTEMRKNAAADSPCR